ncbi:hypothetical protein QWY20_17290 [Alkalimonas sp. MEB108]|uniref:Uncharacterized protein n=1 Tax=Alkalimonas cellulosilytica TaxID=3058395 RepID=A0ABU7JA49_9GAMM|nr:hypothetical protein [Alkalimonas sp. MEB108]MEE2003212.1 hypothetical protein [Alkalimonas sp. MEB108]
MTSIINILEKMGQTTAFEKERKKLSLDSEMLELPLEVQQALNHGNVEQLNQILQVRAQVVCGLHPAEDPDQEDKEKDDEEDEDNKHQKQAQLKSAGDKLRHAG